MIIVGNKIYERCADCGALVRVNKFLFGALHICLSPEEIEQKRANKIPAYPPISPQPDPSPTLARRPAYQRTDDGGRSSG